MFALNLAECNEIFTINLDHQYLSPRKSPKISDGNSKHFRMTRNQLPNSIIGVSSNTRPPWFIFNLSVVFWPTNSKFIVPSIHHTLGDFNFNHRYPPYLAGKSMYESRSSESRPSMSRQS